MQQPNPRASQALLIGVSRYAYLDDLPAVDNNLLDLRHALTDPELWGNVLALGTYSLVKHRSSGTARDP